MEQVILVDEKDREVGFMEKMEAHRQGILHRAFSILLFNAKGEMLLQKRSRYKYHSAGLWSNTCCSHPLPGESMADAMRRKLHQEMGIETHLEYAFKFIYKADVGHGLHEHEFDHVYVGKFTGEPNVDPGEAEDWRFVNMENLNKEIRKDPSRFTHWFLLILNHPELQAFAF